MSSVGVVLCRTCGDTRGGAKKCACGLATETGRQRARDFERAILFLIDVMSHRWESAQDAYAALAKRGLELKAI